MTQGPSKIDLLCGGLRPITTEDEILRHKRYVSKSRTSRRVPGNKRNPAKSLRIGKKL